MKPVCLARFDERPRIVLLPDGVLMACFVRYAGAAAELAARFSEDDGASWGEPQAQFGLDPAQGGWGGCECLVDRDGEVHVFLLNDAHTGVLREAGGEGEKQRNIPAEKRLDIWHAKSEDGRRHWRAPKRIWQGYTGALNSVIQMACGRILLPFSCLAGRSWGDRGDGLDAFTYTGGFDSTLVYSDDAGDNWGESPCRLKVQTPNITGAYGACEPVVLELRDGRVWMLMRTQKGRFYESFSADGISWQQPRPTQIISSDSPAGLTRLPDGRIVLLWNACLRFPYALGGRHVLHAALSDDEGATWRGCREVARDPFNHQPPPPSGDHGTAYPYPGLTGDGRVVFTTGQGKGRVAIVRMDPDWLLETAQEDDFSHGLDDWSVFGTKGVGLAPHPKSAGAEVLKICRSDDEFPAAAVWNFPLGAAGALTIRLRAGRGFVGASVMLTDHFSVPFDPEDELHALYVLRLDPQSVALDRWSDLRLDWRCADRECEVMLDGRRMAALPQLRTGEGACYLRLRSTACGAEPAGFMVESVRVKIALDRRPLDTAQAHGLP